MTRSWILLGLCGFLAICAAASGPLDGAKSVGDAQLSKAASTTFDPAGLKAENRRDRENSDQEIRKRYNELVEQLIQLAEQKVDRLNPEDPKSSYPWRDSKHMAISLLGDFRAPAAIRVLMENLGYRNPRTYWTHGSWNTGHFYPAAEALWKIGMPAVGPVIEKLAQGDTSNNVRSNCCWVLREILGPRLGRLRIEIAIEQSRDAEAKKNLAGILPYFETDKEKTAAELERRKNGENPG